MVNVSRLMAVAETHIDQNIPDLIVSPPLIIEVFQNLIRNGIESMPNGGKLKLKATLIYDNYLQILRNSILRRP